MLGAYPRASRSRGSPASRAMPWVVATAASISSISASSVARGFADSPGMPAKRRRAARSVRRTARSGGVPEGAVELLVAHLRKQRGDPDVRDLHVLEMALQHEGDLHGALGGARRAAHGRRLAHFARARQGGARRRRRPGAESIFEDTFC